MRSSQDASEAAARKLLRNVFGPAASDQNAPSSSILLFGSETTPAERKMSQCQKTGSMISVFFCLGTNCHVAKYEVLVVGQGEVEQEIQRKYFFIDFPLR